MKTVSGLTQGSASWHAHRAAHFNASDAPAMLGISPYKTRSQLLQEIATGIIAEVDEATQRRFDDGHRFEALARPLAEKIIGDDLSPVVGVKGKLSASFDGLTFDESIYFEHKTINDTIRNAIGDTENANLLPEYLRVQMEQQGAVSDADRGFFMASRWENDVCVEEVHGWYTHDPELRERIIAGWAQFEIDLANYQHVEAAPEVIAAPVMDLPALSIQVSGSISLITNLQRFGARLNEFVSAINKEPSDDQGFADAESAIKTLQNAQNALEAAEANALAQTSDIDDMRKTVKLYADTARTTRLMLEKMVKARKESIRVEIVTAANVAFGSHIESLEAETRPIRLTVTRPDFAGAIKGKRTIASLHDAANTTLANAKIEANALAADIRAKLAWCKESSAGYGFLFNDLAAIISKPMDDFQLVVKTRIDQHKAEELRKEEELRARLVAEEEAKALAKVKEEQEAIERAKVEAERKAKTEADALIAADQLKAGAALKAQSMVQESEIEAARIEERRKAVQLAESAKRLEVVPDVEDARPSRAELLAMLADGFDVSEETALFWILAEFRGDIQHEIRIAA